MLPNSSWFRVLSVDLNSSVAIRSRRVLASLSAIELLVVELHRCILYPLYSEIAFSQSEASDSDGNAT